MRIYKVFVFISSKLTMNIFLFLIILRRVEALDRIPTTDLVCDYILIGRDWYFTWNKNPFSYEILGTHNKRWRVWKKNNSTKLKREKGAVVTRNGSSEITPPQNCDFFSGIVSSTLLWLLVKNVETNKLTYCAYVLLFFAMKFN